MSLNDLLTGMVENMETSRVDGIDIEYSKEEFDKAVKLLESLGYEILTTERIEDVFEYQVSKVIK